MSDIDENLIMPLDAECGDEVEVETGGISLADLADALGEAMPDLRGERDVGGAHRSRRVSRREARRLKARVYELEQELAGLRLDYHHFKDGMLKTIAKLTKSSKNVACGTSDSSTVEPAV